jgi:hypothetical protein
VVRLILTATNPSGCFSSDTIDITIDPTLGGVSVTGQLVYDNSNYDPLNQGTIYLRYPGGRIDSTNTVGSGSFLFTGILDSTYVLSAKTTQSWGGVTVTDAALINTHVTIPTLSGLKEKAADVDGNGMVLANDAQQTALRAAELPIFNSFDNGSGPGNWVHDTSTFTVSGQNLQVQSRALSYGDVDASYSPVLRRQNSLIHTNHGHLVLPAKGIAQIPVTVTSQSNLGSFQMDFLLPDGDQLVNVKLSKHQDPVLFKQSGNKVRIVWYSQNQHGMNLNPGDKIFTLEILKSNSTDIETAFELIGSNEVNDLSVHPLYNFEIQTPSIRKSNQLGDASLFLYPNPVRNGNLYLKLNQAYFADIKISDIQGKTMYQSSSTINQTRAEDIAIQVDDWAPGQYVVQVQTILQDGSSRIFHQTFTVRP